MRHAALLCLSVLVVAGCQTSPEVPVDDTAPITKAAPALDATDLDYVFYPGEPMRHAYRDVTLRPQAKADGDEVRWAYPERYAMTEAPPAGVRAMVEWEPMEAVVMQVPDYIENYDGVMGTIQGIGAGAITVAEVWYVVESGAMKSALKDMLWEAGVSSGTIESKTRFLTTPLESLWFIDSGPLPIIDPATNTYAFADFRYYQDRALDDGVPTLLGRNLVQMGEPNNTDTYRMPVHTEGGTFQATTDGVCFTGARQLYNMSCLETGCDSDILFLPLSQLQTHPYTQELEASWGAFAGCEDVVVTYSITDDGTGHIDMYMKVASDDLVIMGEYEPPYGNDAAAYNATRMDANADFLESYVKPNGGGFTVGRIVMPGHRNTNEGAIPFTYINSTMINGVNLWPATTYANWSGSRSQAAQQWASLLPGYEHIWVDSTEISYWSGAVHCITRTIPDKAPGLWVGDGSCQGGSCQAPAGGYDSACYPTDYTTSPICWGPDWLCGCHDCDLCGPPPGGGGTPDDPCDGITYEGCCDGNTLKYCENGQIKGGSCGGQGCGWKDGAGFYDCNQSGADPSGTFPLSCDGEEPCQPSCAGKVCGADGCGGSCGTCGANEDCTSAGQCVADCTPSCTGVECGADGCGGSCGTCGVNEDCTSAGQCVLSCIPNCGGVECGADGCGGSCGTCATGETCESGQCEAPPTACGDLTYEGCCEDMTLHWCQDGEPLTQTCDNSCGWHPQYGYLCEETGEDPTGEYPLSCGGEEPCVPQCLGQACGDDGCGGVCGTCQGGTVCEAGECIPGPCVPDCTDKNCGQDGCGGSCGVCPEGEGCNAAGLCVSVCVPNCAGNVCGTDGCGGSCGTCADGTTCEAGQCVGGCGDIVWEGCCDGTELLWCQNGQIESLSCSTTCGWSASADYYDCGKTGADPSGTFPLSCEPEPCSPSCDGLTCGDDGCGGVCGTCPTGETCEGGQCQPGPCVPNCAGLDCGADGCGGSCGTCGPNTFCTDAGLCEAAACVPDCEGKACGDDGCGGVCGTCNPGQYCTSVGHCKATACTPDCEGKTCGADGCGGSCGSCAAGSVCIAGSCTGSGCTPDCEDKVCGADGCGGWCGTCAPDELCTSAGECVLPQCTPDCTDKTCGEDGCGGLCGACPAGQACTPGGQCVADCESDCVGKACGDDGCGGLCGSCDAGLHCSSDYQCVEGACVPDCDGKQCGDDGCGQLCGECAGGETCSPQAECVPSACVPDCAFKDCGDDGCGGSCGGCPGGQVCGKDFRCEPAPCEPDCEGLACGDDGCGGVCGTCLAGEECTKQGACVAPTCTPSCEGLACGDDGCGGSCGVCAEGFGCASGECAKEVDSGPGTGPVVDPGNPGTGTSGGTAPSGGGQVSGEGSDGGPSDGGCQGGSGPERPMALLTLLLLGWLVRRRSALG